MGRILGTYIYDECDEYDDDVDGEYDEYEYVDEYVYEYGDVDEYGDEYGVC